MAVLGQRIGVIGADCAYQRIMGARLLVGGVQTMANKTKFEMPDSDGLKGQDWGSLKPDRPNNMTGRKMAAVDGCIDGRCGRAG